MIKLQRQQLTTSTTLYRSGTPIVTGAVVRDIASDTFSSVEAIPHFLMETTEKGIVLRCQLAERDGVYGLGQQMGGLNKRGRQYCLYNIDEGPHTPMQKAMYGSHPFFFVKGEQHFGVFLDYPSKMDFDIGFSRRDMLEITLPTADFDLYLFEAENTREIISAYLTLTGSPYIPPKWAFGYHQSKYGYKNETDIREVAEKFREHDIPCDAIYLDIDYLDNYKDFTVNTERFPDLPGLVQEMKERGIQLVPIIDAAVKAEEGYDICDEGRKRGYFCVDKDGKEFICAVWPGLSLLPDVHRAEVRTWWGSKYKMLTDMGIEGVWNDMDEPAIFYTTRHLDYVEQEMIRAFKKREIGQEFFDVTWTLSRIFNRPEYYDAFYHIDEHGDVIPHKDVHNLYGFNLTRAAADAFGELLPGKRYFMLSRSSYAGLHRFSGIWTGDNDSWWEHLLLHIRMLMSLNLCGFFYTGADIGGFGSDASPEMVVRWTQMGVFSPLCRNHASCHAKNQEPWSFDEKITEAIRQAVRLRYALLPYTYSEFMQAAQRMEPFISPLFLEFAGERVRQIDDQFLYGRSVMAAPVYTPNSRGRFVHLPQCRWLCWIAADCEKREMRVIEPGEHYIEIGFDETPLFIRENHLLVLAEPANSTQNMSLETLTVVGLVTDRAELIVYDDDGETTGYQNGQYAALRIVVENMDGEYAISCEKEEHGGFHATVKRLRCDISNAQGEVFQKTVMV